MRELIDASDLDSSPDCKIKIPWDNAIDYSCAECREEFSYNSLLLVASKARDKSRGKYIASWCRLKIKADKTIVLTVHSEEFLHIYPDNTAKVMIDSVSYCPQTLVSSLSRFFPIIVWRHRTNLYRIAPDFGFLKYLVKQFNSMSLADRKKYKLSFAGYGYWRWWEKHMRIYGSVFKKGLIIDLNTGEITNRDHSLEPVKAVEDKDKRKVWRANITRAKRSLRIALKLGVFGKLWEEVLSLAIANPDNYWKTPEINWHSEDRIMELADAINLETLPTPISNSIMFSVMKLAVDNYEYSRATDSEKLKHIEVKLNTFFNELSTPLRKYLGVITKQATYSNNSSSYISSRNVPIVATDEITAKLVGTRENEEFSPSILQELLDGKFKIAEQK